MTKVFRKIFLCAAILTSMVSWAQGAGTWRIHPIVGATPAQLVDAGEFVYYVMSNNLYRYDKETSENRLLDKSNELSDVDVKKLYFNSVSDNLVVVYSNSNIDIIDRDGNVTNIPDIKDAVLTKSKEVNDVTFVDDYIYVAANFGYAVLSASRGEVKESHIFDTPITSAAEVNGNVILTTAEKTYFNKVTDRHTNLVHFTEIDGSLGSLMPIAAGRFLATTASAIAVYECTGTSLNKVLDLGAVPTSIEACRDGSGYNIFYTATPSLCHIDNNGDNPVTTTLPADVKNAKLSSREADGSWWTASSSGLRHISINGTSIAVITDYIKPNGTTVPMALKMTFNEPLGKLYVNTSFKDMIFTASTYDTAKPIINTYDGNNWEVVSLPTSSKAFSILSFSPEDPNKYYTSCWQTGVYEVADNKLSRNLMVRHTGSSNTAYCVQLDGKGNIWAKPHNDDVPRVLPNDVRLASGSPATSSWIIPDIPMLSGTTWRVLMRIDKKSNLKMYNNYLNSATVQFFREVDALDGQYQYVAMNSMPDQDGKLFTWGYVYEFVTDKTGMVWMCTSNGVVYFNPEKVFDSDFSCVRPKVARNDGTNSADYLLDGITVYGISCDGVNRKWIATSTAGLLLVSADGSEIIKEFNTDNSALPSNKIYTVCCNPASNAVYIGPSTGGVVEYMSDAVEGNASYSEVYVYPNPVRPDYTGLITITGLMTDSLVKIADAAGNVVAEVQSNGGMATWNGCNYSGDRVRTGVYFVIASHSDNSTSEAVVAKFLFVK